MASPPLLDCVPVRARIETLEIESSADEASGPVLSARVAVRFEGEDALREGCSTLLAHLPGFDAQDLERSARAAASVALETHPPRTLFEHAYEIYRRRVLSIHFRDQDVPRRAFGVGLVESALADAWGLTHAAVSRTEPAPIGFEGGVVYPELAGFDPAALTDAPAAARRFAADPGAVGSVGGERWLVQLTGDLERDLQALSDLGDFLEAEGAEVDVAVDACGKLPDIEALLRLLDGLEGRDGGRRLLARLAWLEQPLTPHVSLEGPGHDGIESVAERLPLVLDEGDTGFDSFRYALARGYRGVVVRPERGFLRAWVAAGLARTLGAERDAFLVANTERLPDEHAAEAFARWTGAREHVR